MTDIYKVNIYTFNMFVFFSRNARSGISDWHGVDRQRRIEGDDIMKRGSCYLNAT